MFESLFGNKKHQSIAAQEVKARIDNNDNLLLIDVRSSEEYASGHIEKSISVPLPELAQNIGKYAPAKDAEIILYCLSGNRSARAAASLASMGYTNVKNLGGISSWPHGIV